MVLVVRVRLPAGLHRRVEGQVMRTRVEGQPRPALELLASQRVEPLVDGRLGLRERRLEVQVLERLVQDLGQVGRVVRVALALQVERLQTQTQPGLRLGGTRTVHGSVLGESVRFRMQCCFDCGEYARSELNGNILCGWC